MSSAQYNSWPLGKLPREWQRPEPELVRELGVDWTDPREINTAFEKRLADYAGSKFAILTDCCTNAIYLSLQYLKAAGYLQADSLISIPRRTYVSIPMAIHHAGFKFALDDREWSGEYELSDTGLFDSAAKFTRGMFTSDARAKCLSFQIKKRLPIGRGGVILTNDPEFHDWARLAVYDGRDLQTRYDSDEHVRSLGWHFYMTPEDAARGLLLMNQLPEENPDMMDFTHYPDLRSWKVITDLEVKK